MNARDRQIRSNKERQMKRRKGQIKIQERQMQGRRGIYKKQRETDEEAKKDR